MEIRVDSKNAAVVKGIEPMLAEIQQRLQSDRSEWLKFLQQNPRRVRQLGKGNPSRVRADGRSRRGRTFGASHRACRLRRRRKKK